MLIGSKRTWLVAVCFLLVLTPFIPLLLSIIEHRCFGTRQTEAAFKRIGLHEVLDDFYERCWDLIHGWK
jgi:hypothetical protein